MSTMVMNKSQCCGAERPRVEPRRMSWRPPLSAGLLVQRASVAVGVAAVLGLLVALVAATPTAVEATATPPVLTTVELPRVVIHGTRFTPGVCPLPTDASSRTPAEATCPVPVAGPR